VNVRLLLLCISLLPIAAAQEDGPTVAQLEAMERFAAKSGTRITWSRDIDRIEAGSSTAIVRAVVLETAEPSPVKMKGIQVDFSSDGKRDRIHVSEEYADRLIAALDEIATVSPGFLSRQIASSKCFGTGAFLNAMRSGAHFISPSQCDMADGWRGLSVETGAATFRFTEIDTIPFARAIRAAMNVLKQR
jgi:hypothetical protein